MTVRVRRTTTLVGMAHDEDRVSRVLETLEGDDLELLTPPPGVWAGIEASLGSERARRPPATSPTPVLVVEYRIDAADIVVDVGEGWVDFAVDNDAAELASPDPQRSLWSYIVDGETQELWKMLVERVRTRGTPVNVPFRCDAPHARRWFEMTVSPMPDDGVGFRTVLLFEEPRSRVALLDPSIERDTAVASVPVCSWCGRGCHDDRWLDIEELVRAGRHLEGPPPPIEFGICEPCRDDMAAELLVAGEADEPRS